MTTARTLTTRAATVTAAVVAAAVLAACGGGETEATSPGTPAGGAATQTDAAPTGGSPESDAAPATPTSQDETTTASPAADAGGGLSADQAQQIAIDAAPAGSVLEDDVYQETVGGQPAWEIDVNHPDGTDWDYYVHRENGEVLDVTPGG